MKFQILACLPRGQGGGLLGLEGFRFAGGGLEVVVFDPELAFPDLVLDQRG